MERAGPGTMNAENGSVAARVDLCAKSARSEAGRDAVQRKMGRAPWIVAALQEEAESCSLHCTSDGVKLGANVLLGDRVLSTSVYYCRVRGVCAGVAQKAGTSLLHGVNNYTSWTRLNSEDVIATPVMNTVATAAFRGAGGISEVVPTTFGFRLSMHY